MPIFQSPKERHRIEDEGSSLQVTIPSRRNYFILFFFGFWLIFWAIGEIAALVVVFGGIIQVLFYSSDSITEIGETGLTALLGSGLFLLVWLAAWTAGGGSILYTFLWQLAGKEIIEVSYDTMKIQNAIFGFGRIREYAAPQIKDLRVSPILVDHSIFKWSRASTAWGRPTGLLAFDYGAKTFRFGGGLDEAEAKQILEKIRVRFSLYGSKDKEAG